MYNLISNFGGLIICGIGIIGVIIIFISLAETGFKTVHYPLLSLTINDKKTKKRNIPARKYTKNLIHKTKI